VKLSETMCHIESVFGNTTGLSSAAALLAKIVLAQGTLALLL
jgi:hypothetical protein